MRLIEINVPNYAYSFIKNVQIIDTRHNFFLCLELFVVCANSGACVCLPICYPKYKDENIQKYNFARCFVWA
jgi:hypothetical protein